MPGFENDSSLNALKMISTCSLEQLAIGFPVQHRDAKGLGLADMAAAADTKDHPAAGQDVGGDKVLGETQRVPPRRDGEGAADLQVFVT